MSIKWPWQKATWENTIKANVALSFVVAGITAIAVLAVYDSQSKHERIVITPLVVDKQMSVGWDGASEEYLKAIGVSVAQMVGNLTPENAPFVVEQLSRLMHASIYSGLRNKILALAVTRQYRELASATKYTANGVEYERETGKVFVNGAMEITTATGKEKTPMTYEMAIKIEGGLPVIYFFDNYADVSHTREWIASHPAAAEKKEGEVK